MKERPILFSAPMVRAILAGTKSQTRRVVKPQPNNVPGLHHPIEPYLTSTGNWNWVLSATGHGTGDPFPCPYGQPGDRLYVKEKHAFLDVRKSALSQFPLGPQNGNAVGPDVWNLCVEYCDGTENDAFSVEGIKPKQTRERGEDRWRPSIHMPRWASRVLLEITAVRVERLNEISEADAKAEGVTLPTRTCTMYDGIWRDEYRLLWESINGAGSWAANPWVWAISFRRINA